MTKRETEERILILEQAVIKMAMWISLLSGGNPAITKEVSILIHEVAHGKK